MKRSLRNVALLLLALLLLAVPAVVRAGEAARLRLATENLNLAVGQEATLALLVENAPLIYGVESHLKFDPAVLEVTGLHHGAFLAADPATQAFVLQNQANNATGTIDYALVLLNPAPPVKGNGLLASITFRARAAGPTAVEITEAMFGTQTGEEIVPQVENAALTIAASRSGQPAAGPTAVSESSKAEEPILTSENSDTAPADVDPEIGRPRRHHVDNEAEPGSNLWLGLSLLGLAVITGLIGLVSLAGLVGGWFLLVRSLWK